MAATLQRSTRHIPRAFAVACLAPAALALLAFAAACGGDDANLGGATADDQPNPTVAAASSTPAASITSRTTAQPTVASPPTTGGQEVDNTPLLPCNNILVPLDKNHRLAQDCVPAGLVSLPGAISYGGQQLMTGAAAAALQVMLAAAATDGLRIYAISSYRSYDQQLVTFQQNVAAGGHDYAERTSAHAGHSEHQLGTTTDLTSASNGYGLEGFETTAEGKWIATNSWRYGFIVSYPPGKEAITGYAYEPWHVCWLGTDVAAKVQASGLTLHEYLLKQ
jgi:zinc D-Ala-D-Ala carboxypeptidase